MDKQHLMLFLDFSLAGLMLFIHLKHFSNNGFHTEHLLGDRLHSVFLNRTSDNHLELLVMLCFGFLSLLYTDCTGQKGQTMGQHLKCDSIKALYIPILQSLQIKNRYWCK